MSINVAAIPSPFIHSTIKRRKNTWYTIASGNWTDPNIWMSNSHRRYAYPASVFGTTQTGGGTANTTTMLLYPSANDDVYINHTVAVDASNTNNGIVLNNLFVSGNLSMATGASRGITVVGDLQVTGTLDMSAGNLGHTIALYGVNNFVNTLITGTNSTVAYMRVGDQFIMNLPYRHLNLGGLATKYLTGNLTVAGNLAAQWQINGLPMMLECGAYNLTVGGASTFSGTMLSKTDTGSILLTGLCTFSGSTAVSGLSLTGNPSIEFRGGITSSLGSSTIWNTGTTTWNFTTNTQSVNLTQSGVIHSWTAPISVIGAIDLTVTGGAVMSLNQPIDHTVAGRTTTNKGTIYFNSTASLPSFTTGTFDRTSFANTVGYTMPASITLPYTNYYSLLVSNSGTKTLAGNTTLSGQLSLSNVVVSGGTLDFSTYDITVGATTVFSPNSTLLKSGSGNVIFVGQVDMSSSSLKTFDFTGGNPTVELRGGIYVNAGTFNTGTGTWTFSTNNQTATNNSTLSSPKVFSGNVLINGAITVTFAGQNPSTNFWQFNGDLNGNNVASTVTNNTGLLFNNLSATIMSTGIFNYKALTTSYIGYNGDGDYTLPFTSYEGLVIGGTGTKSASSHLTVRNTNVYNSGTLELSSFNFTGLGTTQITLGTLSKTGSGNVLFTGQLILTTSNSKTVNFSGNPSVELRGGMVVDTGTNLVGGGTWSFTTNNQTITNSVPSTVTFNMPIVISGAITLTASSASGAYNLIFTNTINGNNAASTLDNRISSGGIQYQATQQPMLTGVLQTNAAANTFIYNKAGDQDIKGGTYRVLTLAGSGVKTLQGNVVVATTYTLTPPATLNLNGFTRT